MIGNNLPMLPVGLRADARVCGQRAVCRQSPSGASLCVAVHRNIRGSRGTKDCARRCLAAGIPTWLIDSEDVRPRRIDRDWLEARP
jgi:hypothetical protein